MLAKIIEVIYTDLEHRGMGKSEDDVYRRLIQFWTKEGELIFEYDPHTGESTTGPGITGLWDDGQYE